MLVLLLLYLTFSGIQTELHTAILRSMNYLAFQIIVYHEAVLMRFVAGFQLRRPWFDSISGHMLWTMWHWGRFSTSISASSHSSHSTGCCISNPPSGAGTIVLLVPNGLSTTRAHEFNKLITDVGVRALAVPLTPICTQLLSFSNRCL
jgi:hypothetical protein